MTASRALRDRLTSVSPNDKRRADRVLDKLEPIFARRSASRAAVRSAGELSRRLRRRVPLSYFTAPCWFTDVADCPGLFHYWYAQFHCERPGSGGSR